ncbi:MAG: Asp23/Gls24 family envelope stress response protein [Anaerovoracaceae bacterium]|jgi:uncharacterized alkaline shock family protein YloU
MKENSVKKTEYGNIAITRNAVGQVLMRAVEKHRHNVMLSNRKGRVIGKITRLSGYNQIDDMEIFFDDDGAVSVKVYLVIRFGASITRTCVHIVDDIHSGLVSVMGREPKVVTVAVKGILSKNLAKRNIEVSRSYGDK